MNPLLKESIDLITDIEFNLIGNEKLFKKIKQCIGTGFEITLQEKEDAKVLIDEIQSIALRAKELRDLYSSAFETYLKR